MLIKLCVKIVDLLLKKCYNIVIKYELIRYLWGSNLTIMYNIFGIELTLHEYSTLFFIFQLVNVGLSTTKTIIMYRKKKLSSANINAISYGFYAIIVIMTASDLPIWLTISITLVTNWIGVYFSMMILEYIQGKKKPKLWEIVATIPYDTLVVEEVANKLIKNDISLIGEINNRPSVVNTFL